MFISLVLAVIAISSTTASLNDIGSDLNAANLWDEDLRAVAADKVIELTPSTLPRSHFPSSMQGWFDPSENEQGINHAMRRLQLTGYEGPEGLMPPTFVTTYWGKEMVDKIKTYFTHDATVAQEERNGTMIRGGMRMKCRHTRGRWCGRYESQPDLPFKPPPRGSKQCPDNCNNVGNCSHDLGICYCTAGWKGDDCKVPEKRPCSNGDRAPGSLEPQSHIDKDGNDLNWLESGWRASRCAGVCDDDVAMCYCGGKNEKLRRINAPVGSPPGTPPINRGRPLSEWCGKVKETAEGKNTDWGNVPYALIYGPNGFCEKEIGGGPCDNCMVDDIGGRDCNIIKEAYCPGNQCSGHGDCNLGYCKCHKGWYGLDCSRRAATEQGPAPPSDAEGRKPWLKTPGLGKVPIAALEAPPAELTRKRPLIYVYDSPPPYTTRMLQYRLVWKSCVWRHFRDQNETELNDWLYGVETYFHEVLLMSPHRTFDPEEADFFFVPLYVTCFFWPIIGWADHPWWHAPNGFIRPMHGANMMLDLKRWLEKTFPYWNHKGGKDHIWLTAADEGACWMPQEIYENSIILTHFGRMDRDPKSATAFVRDNYDAAFQGPFATVPYQGDDWRKILKLPNGENHVCYNPRKDLVIPSLKLPGHYAFSPLLAGDQIKRDVLLFFKGDVGSRRDPNYSRGIRQKLHKLSKESWAKKHAILILESTHGGTPYSLLLSRSIFCLVAPGDGWSARAEDAVLHGCLPLIIMDNVHTVYESILDYDGFSIRVKESSIEAIPAILTSLTADQITRMQRRLAMVMHRFAYTSHPIVHAEAKTIIQRNIAERPLKQDGGIPASYPFQRRTEPHEDDAFATIMQWLFARIDHSNFRNASFR